ncbi:glycosyltransferase [Lachnospiraceae bacterium]|nr:glycosyltransferase [Lachnospiraceae bacterium]
MENYSIVTTVYNNEQEIVIFLDNICSQSYLPEEIIIVDGGSSDRTIEYVNQYSSGSSILIKLFSGKRLNISEGLNMAIRNAGCGVVGITTPGNLFPPDFFETLMKRMAEESLDVAYSAIEGGINTPFSKKYADTLLGNSKMSKIASNHGALVRKTVFEEIGYFYEGFVYAGEDTEFFSLVRERNYKAACISDTKLWWEVPANWKEYIKQIRNYAIADLQILDNKTIFIRISKRIAAVAFPVIILMAGISIDSKLGIITVLAYIASAFMMYINYRIRSKDFFIVLAKKMLPSYYYLKNIKYTKLEYKVHRM